ncbi:MAG: triose-phosphate isomerase [Candidatus Woesearchaeota archaeon]
MKFPLLIVNFKTYDTGVGQNALVVAKLCQKVAKATNTSIAIAVNAVDVHRIASKVRIPVLAQHVDPVGYGAHTGHILIDALKQAGAQGTLLNHAEYPHAQLQETITLCKQKKFFCCVCAPTTAQAKKIATYAPHIIAVEPPELIGSGISVSSAKPSIIKNAVKAVGTIPLLCGAGVSTQQDVSQAMQLGVKGVLLASGVMKSKDIEQTLKALVAGFQ